MIKANDLSFPESLSNAQITLIDFGFAKKYRSWFRSAKGIIQAYYGQNEEEEF